MSKLIVIEGIDGSGKGTQSTLLQARLKKEKYDFLTLSFPQYSNEASYFVRQYLNGNYGMNPEDVSPKEASLFYAMDRYQVFKANSQVKAALSNNGTVLLANRYTTSNVLYQGAKAKSRAELYDLIDWICELEYETLQIPKPDIVIMPHVEIEKNIEMMTRRDITKNAQSNNMSRDIHELDLDYLRRVSETSEIVAERMGFEIIDCMTPSGDIRTVDDIHEEIYNKVYQKVLSNISKK